jgi:hypothetical protein
MRYILIVLVAVAACSAVALAQQPPPAAETSPAPDAGAPAVAGGPPVTGGGGTDVGSRPGFIAVFQGPDSKSYFVREGQRLYDGVVLAVSAAGVTFRQDVTDPLSPVKTRELKKSLDASEEARP